MAPGPGFSAITGRLARDTRDACDARDSCYSRVLSGHGESIQRAPAQPHLRHLLHEEASQGQRLDPHPVAIHCVQVFTAVIEQAGIEQAGIE